MNEMIRGILLLLVVTGQATAQLRYTYDFSNGLNGLEEGAPPLKILGKAGEIKDDPIRELQGNKKLAYYFEANSGLSFDNNLSKGFLDKSYSVEIYFMLRNLEDWRRIIDFKNRKSDNGCYIHNRKVNFFNFATGDNAAVRPGKYTHYIFTRDHKKGIIQIYVDGELKLEFPDKGKEAVLDRDQVLNFFQDDLVVNHEASEGAVAYIRIYDEVVTPVFIFRRFRNLLSHMRLGARDLLADSLGEADADEEGYAEDLVMSGRIYNGKNLQPLSGAELYLKTMSDSVVSINKLTSGDYTIRIRPETAYKLGIFSRGYKPREILVEPATASGSLKTHIRMEEEIFTKPIVAIPFEQSGLGVQGGSWIGEVVAFLESRPDLAIKLEGHTDNVGDFDKNVELSWKRVDAVKKILLENNIAPDRIISQGYGPVRPAVANQSEEARRLNRRVEVWPAHR